MVGMPSICTAALLWQNLQPVPPFFIIAFLGEAPSTLCTLHHSHWLTVSHRLQGLPRAHSTHTHTRSHDDPLCSLETITRIPGSREDEGASSQQLQDLRRQVQQSPLVSFTTSKSTNLKSISLSISHLRLQQSYSQFALGHQ